MSRDDRGFEYAYDYGNRLTAVAWIGTGGPATVGEFAYDALGRMITAYTRFDSDVNGDGETLRYYHDGANVLMEYDDSQTPVLQRYYVHGTGYVDERAVMYDAASDADYYYTLKDLYTVDALINNRGHEVERVTYDAYGMPLMRSIHVADVDYSGTVNATDTAAVVANYGLSVGTVGPIYDIDENGSINAIDSGLVSAAYGSAIGTARVSSVGNPYLFTGRRMHFFETEFTGLGPEANTPIQYNRARHYDPQHGRWLQRDPIGYADGMNLYEYGRSNSARFVDPNGAKMVLDEVKDMAWNNSSGVPRGQVEWKFKKESISCSGDWLSCGATLKVDYSLWVKMSVLDIPHAAWTTHFSRYDAKWGSPRINASERLATISHEYDHWKTLVVGYWRPLKSRVGSYDGKHYQTETKCEAVAACLRTAARAFYNAAAAHTGRFDTPAWWSGNEYDNHPLLDILDVSNCK
jgi:RHS repeat-associated protein